MAEARDRIRELEEEKRISLGELLQGRKEVTHNAELLADVGGFLCILSFVELWPYYWKLDGLAKKVVSRELETIDVLANSAVLTAE